MSDLVLGLDAGNYKIKVCGFYGVSSYSSAICPWFSRDVEEIFGSDDAEYEIDGMRGFSGTIAEYEDAFGGESMYGLSKAHNDTKVRVLVSIYRYIKEHNLSVRTVSLVVGQPIKRHVKEEKDSIINMLKGNHIFTVNGERVELNIENVGVCAEGSGSFWSLPINPDVRVIDLGSGTCNLASVRNKKFLNNMSDSLNFGANTGRSKREIEDIATGIIRATTRLQWNVDDLVYVCGGIAEEITFYIKKHYKNAEALYPPLEDCNDASRVNPIYSNVIGFYNIAKATFKWEKLNQPAST